MAMMDGAHDYNFAWDGEPAHLAWSHLRVLEFAGEETLNEPFWFEIELHRDEGAPDVGARELIGSRAALCWRTHTEPGWRIVHGVIASAVELGDIDGGAGAGRYRVVLRPPSWQRHLLEEAHIHLDESPQTIVDATLKRVGLTRKDGARPAAPSGLPATYAPPQLTYSWRISSSPRLDDAEARPYCVQYFEPDLAFISRILEEEGISYHYEHGEDECRLVMSDFDQGRMPLDPPLPLGPELLGREVPQWNDGARMSPRAAHLDDYDWRRPELDLGALSHSAASGGITRMWPGRYGGSQETGRLLAEVREQRFDSERHYAHGSSRCRALGAGSVFHLDHPKERLRGSYLVTSIRHRGRERGWFAADPGLEPYTAEIECLCCDAPGDASDFRPALVTPRPRIYGVQTAVVTAEPEAQDAEINVGGPAELGCVRVRFMWDIEASNRLQEERQATSCWIRVSQLFAGASHGAMWHPRVGEEVIVEHLDGDPDRPIVTGRVYNGQRRPHVSATQRPTYSAIHSLTSPYNGNYHLISFDDLQGQELFLMHASRDMQIDIERNYTRNTKAHDAINAGSQSISVGSWQTISVGTEQTITVGTNQTIGVGGDQAIGVVGNQAMDIGGNRRLSVGINETIEVGANQTIGIGGDQSLGITGSQAMDIGGDQRIEAGGLIQGKAGSVFHSHGGAFVYVTAGSGIIARAPDVHISGIGSVHVRGPRVTVSGSDIHVDGGTVAVVGAAKVTVHGATVEMTGGTINVGAGTVNINGGAINLNC